MENCVKLFFSGENRNDFASQDDPECISHQRRHFSVVVVIKMDICCLFQLLFYLKVIE